MNRTYQISDLVAVLHDAPLKDSHKPEQKTQILESYFNDLYKLFVARLTMFESSPVCVEADKHKLRSLLEELINVKNLLSD